MGAAVTLALLVAAALMVPGTTDVALFVLMLAGVALVIGALAPSLRAAVFAAGALAVAAVVVSPLIDRVVVQPADGVTEKRFGLPVPFVEAELTLTPTRPVEARLNPWEDPATMLANRLLAGAAAAVLLAGAAAALAARLRVEVLSARASRPRRRER